MAALLRIEGESQEDEGVTDRRKRNKAQGGEKGGDNGLIDKTSISAVFDANTRVERWIPSAVKARRVDEKAEDQEADNKFFHNLRAMVGPGSMHEGGVLTSPIGACIGSQRMKIRVGIHLCDRTVVLRAGRYFRHNNFLRLNSQRWTVSRDDGHAFL